MLSQHIDGKIKWRSAIEIQSFDKQFHDETFIWNVSGWHAVVFIACIIKISNAVFTYLLWNLDNNYFCLKLLLILRQISIFFRKLFDGEFKFYLYLSKWTWTKLDSRLIQQLRLVKLLVEHCLYSFLSAFKNSLKNLRLVKSDVTKWERSFIN